VISESTSHRPSASSGNGARPITLRLLDGFELRRGGEPIRLPLGCQRVVAFLALRRRPLTRVHVAGMLWIDVSEARSCGNLRSALWRIRQRCGPLVQTTPTHVSLARELMVDVDAVVASTRRVLDDDTVSEAELDTACAPGALLPDWYDDWLEPERERLRQLRLHALEAAAERLLESGRAPHRGDPLLPALSRAPDGRARDRPESADGGGGGWPGAGSAAAVSGRDVRRGPGALTPPSQ
jgi:hypothetical protein